MRFCWGCGAWSQTPFLCDVCDASVRQARLFNNQKGVRFQGFTVRTIFDWDHPTDRPLRTLLSGLKGGHDPVAFRCLAELFLTQEWRLPASAVFVPAPSRHGLDHASQWGWALSVATGRPLWPLLQHVRQGRSQRGRDKKARSQMQLHADAPARRWLQQRPRTLIFVDDVITTGATALAAHQALGKPRFFEVWALARRSLVC